MSLYGVKIPARWTHKPIERQESEALSQCPSPRDDEFALKAESVTEKDIAKALMEVGGWDEDEMLM